LITLDVQWDTEKVTDTQILHHSNVLHCMYASCGKNSIYPTRYRPRDSETICLLPADGSLTVAKIVADPHPSVVGSTVRTSLVVAKLQAASVSIA